MPYGNKSLHFGHIGGLFVHADVYARFLRDRIGTENVIFVSGTDCYGSPIEASFKNEKDKGYNGTIESYVMKNHKHQKETLRPMRLSRIYMRPLHLEGQVRFTRHYLMKYLLL